MGQLRKILLNVTLLNLVEDVGESGHIMYSSNYELSTNYWYLPGLTLPRAFHVNSERYILLLTFFKHEEMDFEKLTTCWPSHKCREQRQDISILQCPTWCSKISMGSRRHGTSELHWRSKQEKREREFIDFIESVHHERGDPEIQVRINGMDAGVLRRAVRLSGMVVKLWPQDWERPVEPRSTAYHLCDLVSITLSLLASVSL